MMVAITPKAPALPPITAVQDPAVRQFLQAIQGAINTIQSPRGALDALALAANALATSPGAVAPQTIAQWLANSELFKKLNSAIADIDIGAKRQLLEEAMARQTAIAEIRAALADLGKPSGYDPARTYAKDELATYDGKLYRAVQATVGHPPTDATYWQKVGDYASIGDIVAAHTLAINDHESRIVQVANGLTAETIDRSALAVQVRGGYTGTDVNALTQGLLYAERVARATADSTEVARRETLSAKLTGTTDPSGLTLGTLSSGMIFEERTARAAADTAMAHTIVALTAQVGAAEGAIVTEQTVRATNDAALVQAINTMWSITGASQAISQSGTNLVTNWTTANANYWNQLSAEVFTAGGKSIRAALAEEASVRATQTGELYGQYTVKLDLNGYVAGFGLASSSNAAGVSTSAFIVRADRFALVMPGFGSYVPFSVTSGGVSYNGSTPWSGVTGTPGLGVNLLQNTEFIGKSLAPAVLNYAPYGTDRLWWGLESVRDPGGDAFRPSGGDALAIVQASGPVSSSADSTYAEICMNGPRTDPAYGLPVVAGKRYEFSGKAAAFNCKVALFLDFFDATGGWLSRVPYVQQVVGTGGKNLSNWTPVWVFGVAPAGAAFASVMPVKCDTAPGFGESHAWFTQLLFGEANAAQVSPSTYVPGAARGAFAALNKITSANQDQYIASIQIGGGTATKLTIDTAQFSLDQYGNAKFAGQLVAATGTFAGKLAAGVIDSSAFNSAEYHYSSAGAYSINVPSNPEWATVSAKIVLQGAGGGGGGAASQGGAGSGGGAGSRTEVTLNGLTPGASYTLVVGAGGAGGAGGGAWNNNQPGRDGGNGGATILLGVATAAGGTGARGTVDAFGNTPGSIGGEWPSGPGMGVIVDVLGGSGGSSMYSAGGGPGYGVGNSGSSGSGGAGGARLSVNAFAGGRGGDGLAVITFFDPNMVVLNTRYSALIAWLDGLGHGPVPPGAR